MSFNRKSTRRIGALSFAAFAVVLTACGGGRDTESASAADVTDTPSATTPSRDESSTDDGGFPGGGANPFRKLTECLTEQGLEVTEPSFGGPGGGNMPGGQPPDRSVPTDFSIPEGGFPDGSFPTDGSLPPDFSVPEGGFPQGGPNGGQRPEGGLPGGGRLQDPAQIAQSFGLDADDPEVTAAIEECTADLD